MAERHETSTGFTTEPYTEVPLADMSPSVRKATGDLLSTAVSVHKFQYRHIDGTGSVVGLRASIESIYRQYYQGVTRLLVRCVLNYAAQNEPTRQAVL